MIPGVAGQHAAGIDGGRGPVPGVHVRQPPCAGQVDVAQAAGGAGRGLVRVDRLRLPQQPRHQVREAARIDQGGGLRPHPGHPPSGGPQPGQLRHQLRRPAHGDIVPAGQQGRLSVRFRPVAGPRPHARRQFSLADRAAARAHLRLRHVLGDLRRRRGLNVSDLVAALREDLLARPGPRRTPGTAPAGTRTGAPGRPPGASSCPARPAASRAPASPSPAATGPAAFFLYGLSDDGGFDDVEESFPARRSRAPTRAASGRSPRPPPRPARPSPAPGPSAARSPGTPPPAAQPARHAARRQAPPQTAGQAHRAQHATMPPRPPASRLKQRTATTP